jgi:hypothetical protein
MNEREETELHREKPDGTRETIPINPIKTILPAPVSRALTMEEADGGERFVYSSVERQTFSVFECIGAFRGQRIFVLWPDRYRSEVEAQQAAEETP